MALLVALLAATSAFGQPGATAGVALVLGESHYQEWPPLPACIAGSTSLASQLTDAGYTVIGGGDLSNGAAKAAIIAFTNLAALRPEAPTVVYVCGYGVSFEARYFVVPVSAALDRPGDVLTQGVVARGLLTLPAGSGPGLNLLDLYASPGQSLDGIGPFLAGLSPQPGRVMAAAVEQARPDGATPLAQSFSEAFKPELSIDALVAEMRRGMSRRGDVGLYAAGSANAALVGHIGQAAVISHPAIDARRH